MPANLRLPMPQLVGEPCEVKVGIADGPRGIHNCGDPARFIYYGLDPAIWAATKSEQKRMLARGNPCTMLMCADHAKRLIDEWSWHIKDGKVRIERLDFIVYRSFCTSCLTFTRIQLDLSSPTKPTEFAPEFCPACGAKQPIRVMPEQDYWDIISEHFNGMPVELVKMLYTDWPRKRYRTFTEFVESQIAEFDSTGELSSGD